MKQALLSVRDLTVTFVDREKRETRAVDGVSFDVRPGETVAIVGESGCGKTVSSLAVMGLLPEHAARVGGEVVFDGQPLLGLPEDEQRQLRGRDMAMVFQDPMTSLNPVLTVGRQIAEVARVHLGKDKRESREYAVEMLTKVGIPDAARRAREYPHQMSGGMRQRAMIAIALACEPRLLFADEPTTALDVTIQAQILELLRALVVDSETALVLITHDLGVVAGMCDAVHVMYAGRIVESAPRRELFGAPRHPYTTGLLGSVPRLDQLRGEPLRPIAGSPRDTIPWPGGCAFSPRCPNAAEDCVGAPPALESDLGNATHLVRCLHPVPLAQPAERAEPSAGRRAATRLARGARRVVPDADPEPPAAPPEGVTPVDPSPAPRTRRRQGGTQ